MQAITKPDSIEEASNRTAIFSIVCSAHFVNHFQSAMLGVIYPLMMKELGMTYIAIASLAAVYNTLGSVFQAGYGFVVPYVRRGVILGVGNCLLGLSVTASGFAYNFNHFFTARLVGGIGSSPQHPVGSSLLASHFAGSRGSALAFHSTSGQLGSLFAPLTAALLVTYLGWRGVFWAVGSFSIAMGLVCFAFRDSLRHSPSRAAKIAAHPQGGKLIRPASKTKIFSSSPWFSWLAPRVAARISTKSTSFRTSFMISKSTSPTARFFHVYPGRQLDRTICMGLDLGSLQSQTGDSSVTVDVGRMHALAGVARNRLRRTFGIWSFRRRRHFAPNAHPSLLSDLVGEDLFDAAFQPLLLHRLRLDSVLDCDHRRCDDYVRFWTRLHGDLDFLFARHGSSGISPCAGESTQRELTGHV